MNIRYLTCILLSTFIVSNFLTPRQRLERTCDCLSVLWSRLITEDCPLKPVWSPYSPLYVDQPVFTAADRRNSQHSHIISILNAFRLRVSFYFEIRQKLFDLEPLQYTYEIFAIVVDKIELQQYIII
jgi:hypothetical protein